MFGADRRENFLGGMEFAWSNIGFDMSGECVRGGPAYLAAPAGQGRGAWGVGRGAWGVGRGVMQFKQFLTVRHLRLIDALGRELSVSRCADVLHTSQSAISRGLSDIEAMLGASLFERTTRRMTPTPFGQSLIWHAQQVLSQLDRAEADFAALSRGVGGAIEIGVQGGCSPPLLVSAIEQANRQNPNLTVRIGNNFADGLMPDLLAGRYNLIITHLDIREFAKEDLAIDVLYQEHVGVLAAHDHPLARRPRLGWADLADQRWVMTPMATSTRRIVERNLLMHAPGRPPIIVESMHLQYVISLVREAAMLTALPMRLARWFERDLGAAAILPVSDEGSSWAVCAVRLRARAVSAAEMLFLSCLKKAADIPVDTDLMGQAAAD